MPEVMEEASIPARKQFEEELREMQAPQNKIVTL